MPLPGIDSYASLAGTLQDYTEVVDPTTDLPAVASNAVRADVAGMTALSPRATVIWTNDGSVATIDLRTVTCVGAVTLTITKQALGQWRIEFPAFSLDLTGQPQYWNFRWAHGFAMTNNNPFTLQCTIVSPNQVDVWQWDDAGTANDLAGYDLGVSIY